MDKSEIVELAANIIISMACGTVVGNAIRFTTPANINTVNKVLVRIGTFCIGSMVGEKVSIYTIDMVKKSIAKFKSKKVPTEDPSI